MKIFNRGIRTSALGLIAILGAVTATTLLIEPAYSDDPVSMRTVVLTHEKLIADCMIGRGFDYIVALPRDVIAEEARHAAEDRGAEAAETAAVQATRGLPENPNELAVGKLPPDEQVAWGDALWGTVNVAGCFDQTFESAYKVDLAEQEAHAAATMNRVKADPAVAAAQLTYVSCMGELGYAMKDVTAINGFAEAQGAGMTPEAAAVLRENARSAHERCIRPYSQTFNELHSKLLTAQTK